MLFFSKLFGLTGEIIVKGKGEFTTKNNTRMCLLALTPQLSAQTNIINLIETYVYKHKQLNNQIVQDSDLPRLKNRVNNATIPPLIMMGLSIIVYIRGNTRPDSASVP